MSSLGFSVEMVISLKTILRRRTPTSSGVQEDTVKELRPETVVLPLLVIGILYNNVLKYGTTQGSDGAIHPKRDPECLGTVYS